MAHLLTGTACLITSHLIACQFQTVQLNHILIAVPLHFRSKRFIKFDVLGFLEMLQARHPLMDEGMLAVSKSSFIRLPRDSKA